jgi:RNA polymerase sigma-70 factor (ECF subfamily)
MGSQTDEQLLPALARGDDLAFTVLYQRRQGAIYRYVLQMTGSQETAAEVTQEVFLALMRQSPRLDPARGTVLSWLYAVARRQLGKHLAAARRYEAIPEEEMDLSVDPRDDLEQTDLLDQPRTLIPTLPAVFREVLLLCVVEEMSYAEAARIAEVPEGTIRSRLHWAKAMLAERMAPAVRRIL